MGRQGRDFAHAVGPTSRITGYRFIPRIRQARIRSERVFLWDSAFLSRHQMATDMATLRAIANAWSYDISGIDVLDAYAAVLQVASASTWI